MGDSFNPYNILKKGYRATLKEQWSRAWAKRGWRALPRIVIGTLGFTAGYTLLYLWDGWQWWKNYFQGLVEKKGMGKSQGKSGGEPDESDDSS